MIPFIPPLNELMSYWTAIGQTVFILDDQTEEGAGTRKRMRHGGNGKIPRHWNSYMQNVTNKVEVFHYLPVYISQTVYFEGNANSG